MDGLGLVFEQQGNTGAGAYNQPSLRIGQNPLDRIAAGIGDQVNIERQNQLIQQRQNEKLNQQALEVGGSGWEVDNDRQLGQYLNAMKTEFVNLQKEGVKPTDYNNPKSRRYWELKQGWENLKNNSLAQKEQFNKTYQMVMQDLNTEKPQFDHEKTFTKMREWQQLPIEERLKTPIDQLLVKKEVPQDIYAAIATDKPDAFSAKITRESGSPEYSASSTRQSFDEAAFKANKKQWYENTEEGKANFLALKGKAWDTVDEAVNVQLERYKTTLPKDQTSKFEKKAPPDGYTINYINSGNANDLMGNLGYGKQSINVPTGDGKTVPIGYKYSTQLGNIDAVVANQSIIDATTGEVIGGTGNMALKSGSIVLAPVYKGTNRPYPLTPNMDQKKLVAEGKIEWKPMVSGKAESGDEGMKESKDVWIPADAVLHGTGDSNKALTRGEAAYYIYQKRADELNNEPTTQASLKGGQNKPVSRATIKSLVGKKGYEGYTEQELIDYYTSQGYTIQ